MMPYAVSECAQRDLTDIPRSNLDRWGRDQTRVFISSLRDAFRKIGDAFAIGSDHREIKLGSRRFVSGTHLIFSLKDDKGHTPIVRVIHQSRDVDAHL
jgi:toxin ParE1/3/4